MQTGLVVVGVAVSGRAILMDILNEQGFFPGFFARQKSVSSKGKLFCIILSTNCTYPDELGANDWAGAALLWTDGRRRAAHVHTRLLYFRLVEAVWSLGVPFLAGREAAHNLGVRFLSHPMSQKFT